MIISVTHFKKKGPIKLWRSVLFIIILQKKASFHCTSIPDHPIHWWWACWCHQRKQSSFFQLEDHTLYPFACPHSFQWFAGNIHDCVDENCKWWLVTLVSCNLKHSLYLISHDCYAITNSHNNNMCHDKSEWQVTAITSDMTNLEHLWSCGTRKVKTLEDVSLWVKFATVTLHHHSLGCTLSCKGKQV